jgi:hypothetical protein
MSTNLRLSSGPNGTRNVYDIIKDMVADYATDNTGVSSVISKYYTSLKADIQNKKALVISPAGTYNFASFGGSSFINGAKDVTLNNTGATWTPGNIFLSTDHISQVGIDHASGKSARIQTANIGATSVTLTAASASAGHISRFSVGQHILVCGWPIQAAWQAPYSFPPNWAFHEFRKITAIVGDTISFSESLEYYYSSSWPEINRGSSNEVDAAGPATIFAISLFWNGTTTVNGGTYDSTGLINCYRENFIINGGTSSSLPIYPSVTRLYRAIGHTATAALTEHDKLCDLVDIQGGNYSQWKCQSSSTHLLQMTGATIGILNGTPANTVLDGCAVTSVSSIGPTSYGRGETFIANDTSFGGNIPAGGLTEKGAKLGTTDPGIQGYMSMSGGVITIPMCMGDSATRTMMPDSSGNNVLFWEGNSGAVGCFKVLSVTADSWPAVDDQSSTTNVTMANGSYNLQVSTGIFVSGDVGKCIIIPGAYFSGGTLRTFITGFTDSQNVTLYDCCVNASGLSASSRLLQWGTCNMYVTTDQAGGLPHSGLYPNGKLFIRVPAVRSISLDNCSGTDQAIDLSQVAARNRPLGEYTKRSYNGQTGFSGVNGPTIVMTGNIVSLKVNVLTAYTGVSSLNLVFELRYMAGDLSTGTYVFYAGSINLKLTGERVMLPNGSTTGALSGDTNLNLPAAAWVAGTMIVKTSRNITAEPSGDAPAFTVELITDQGF